MGIFDIFKELSDLLPDKNLRIIIINNSDVICHSILHGVPVMCIKGLIDKKTLDLTIGDIVNQ
ncbi:MAG TPA: hypothetical protein HA367_01610 [Candidatus Methanofastidiosum sp.]|nr:hypothetical protein [Methanofastidiosum sp.]